MFAPAISRHAVKGLVGQLALRPLAFAPAAAAATTTTATAKTTTVSLQSRRPIVSSLARLNSGNGSRTNDPLFAASTKAASQGVSGTQEGEGEYARTDESVVIEYPEDHDIPAQPIVQGRGGMHFKRTLANFSLEGNVALVTGGARGLGLVMAQALVASGADLAIVDLNRMQKQLLCLVSFGSVDVLTNAA